MRLADSLRWGLVLAAVWACPRVLAADTITVTGLQDDTTNDGQVTLREAILAANSDSSVDGSVAGNGADEIVFATGPGTISLSGTPLPTITDALTITGPGPADLAVDGSGLSRGFHIAAGETVHISGLTVSTGFASASHGGAIVNEGNLTLTAVRVTGNVVTGANGGGIHNAPTGTLYLIGCTFEWNSASSGGAIFNDFGTLNVTDSTLSNNSADGVSGEGGAVLNDNGTLTVASSTISDNHAVSAGGLKSSGGSSVVTIINSTFSGNDVTNSGGAIVNFSGNWTIMHSTITGNLANSDHNLSGTGGGIKFLSGSHLLKNTIVTGNLTGHFSGTGEIADDVSGPVVASSSYNIIGVGTGLTGISNGVNGNQIGTSGAAIDPKLGLLQDNGGSTFTHELLSGSPALDAGIFVPSVAMDQRGVTRPQGSAPDVGSFELFVPTTVPEDLDLQYMSLDSQTYEACNSISAAPSVLVGSSAAVSFRAGSFVVLRNGFSVLSGGELVVVLLLPTGC